MSYVPDGSDIAQRAKAIIRHHYDSPSRCSTSNLAKTLGVSASLLCHRYRAAFGVTIGQDLRQLRIRRACEILRSNPERLIKRVAADVGYEKACYRTFLNAFRAVTGVSPSDFQRNVRNDRTRERAARRMA